jgi:methylenetetrahydrofolate reductase (NADPH)
MGRFSFTWYHVIDIAFGDLDGYGVNLKYPAEQCLSLWGSPQTLKDLSEIFINYIDGKLSSLPWSDSPLQIETGILKDRLKKLNRNGILTINSQPAVDGALSCDTVYGWGPKNGFVFQKAYVEFFISPASFEVLMKKIGSYPYLTFYGINDDGDLITNSKSDTPNAVTWGVFPGQEIVQPTVVDRASFVAWKDEAFELWRQWASIYEAGSKAEKLLNMVQSQWHLINIVDNNFKSRLAIFDLLDEVTSELVEKVLK